MYITDPSLSAVEGEELTPEQQRLQEGVEVLIFAADPSLLPNPAKAGDLIRFHRVLVSCSKSRVHTDILPCRESPQLCVHIYTTSMLASPLHFASFCQVNEYQGKPQLLAKINPGRGCHYCLFDQSVGVSNHSSNRLPTRSDPFLQQP